MISSFTVWTRKVMRLLLTISIVVFVVVVLGIGLTVYWMSGTNREFYPQAQEVTQEFSKILIKNGKCNAQEECVEKYITLSYAKGGFNVSIHGINEEIIISEMISVASVKFFNMVFMTHLYLSFYPLIKTESTIGFSNTPRDLFTIEMER